MAIATKRAAAIVAKDAASAVQLSFVDQIPAGFQKKLQAQRAAAVVKSAEELAELAQIEALRAFRLEARRVFRMADKDSSRAIDFEELRTMAGSLQLSGALMGMLDADQDGAISMEEWLGWLDSLYEKAATMAADFLAMVEHAVSRRAFVDAVTRIFHMADADSSGGLEYHEVASITQDYLEAGHALAGLDLDRDGAISLDEWIQFCTFHWDRSRLVGDAFLDRCNALLTARLPERNFLTEASFVFHEFDMDGSGNLDMQEVLELLPHVEGKDSMGAYMQAYNFIRKADAGATGRLELAAWRLMLLDVYRKEPAGAIAMLEEMARSAPEATFMAKAARAFKAFDVDNDGALDFGEVRAFLGENLAASDASLEFAAAVFKRADRDRDDVIDEVEWRQFTREMFQSNRKTARQFVELLIAKAP